MQPLAKLFLLLVFAALITFLVLSNQGCEKNEDCENNLAHNLVGRTSCYRQSCIKPATTEKKDCDPECADDEECVEGVCLKVGGCAEQGNCPDNEDEEAKKKAEEEAAKKKAEEEDLKTIAERFAQAAVKREAALKKAEEEAAKKNAEALALIEAEKVMRRNLENAEKAIARAQYPNCNTDECNTSMKNFLGRSSQWNSTGSQDESQNFSTCKGCPATGFKKEGTQWMVLVNDEWVRCDSKDDCYEKVSLKF